MRSISFEKGVFAVACLVMAILIAATTRWEFAHDTAVMNYLGWLMAERGLMPYRDFMDPALPVSMLFYWGVNEIGLAHDPQFLLLGSVLAVLVGAFGALALWPLMGRRAWVFAPLYAATLIMMGPNVMLQRDWLSLLFIAPALALALNQAPARAELRWVLIGVFFGFALMTKPQFVLGAPVVVIADAALFKLSGRTTGSMIMTLVQATLYSLAGFAAVVAGVAGCLIALGILDDLLFLLLEYVPTYLGRTFDHTYLPPEEYRSYFWDYVFRFSGDRTFLPFFLLTLLFGALLVFRAPLDANRRVELAMFLALGLVYGFLPALSGQFWNYHYLPFHFFGVMLSALLLGARSIFRLNAPSVWLVRVVVVSALLFYADQRNILRSAFEPRIAKGGNVADYEAAIRRWLPDGERIQPLAHAEGLYHAMLRQKVEVATPFLFDQAFYHHIGTPLNDQLRESFIQALTAAAPALVVEAKLRGLPKGENVSTEFPELRAYLAENYALVEDGDRLTVYRRRDLLDTTAGAPG